MQVNSQEFFYEKQKYFLPPDTWVHIYALLRQGSTVELKLVGGRVDIVEIKRTVKYRLTPPTGEADG